MMKTDDVEPARAVYASGWRSRLAATPAAANLPNWWSTL